MRKLFIGLLLLIFVVPVFAIGETQTVYLIENPIMGLSQIDLVDEYLGQGFDLHCGDYFSDEEVEATIECDDVEITEDLAWWYWPFNLDQFLISSEPIGSIAHPTIPGLTFDVYYIQRHYGETNVVGSEEPHYHRILRFEADFEDGYEYTDESGNHYVGSVQRHLGYEYNMAHEHQEDEYSVPYWQTDSWSVNSGTVTRTDGTEMQYSQSGGGGREYYTRELEQVIFVDELPAGNTPYLAISYETDEESDAITAVDADNLSQLDRVYPNDQYVVVSANYNSFELGGFPDYAIGSLGREIAVEFIGEFCIRNYLGIDVIVELWDGGVDAVAFAEGAIVLDLEGNIVWDNSMPLQDCDADGA